MTCALMQFENSEILNFWKSSNRNTKSGIISLVALAVIGGSVFVVTPPANAQSVPADVTTMITQTVATAQALGGLAIGIFAVGLTPWGARMALHWLGTILRGGI